MGLVHRDFKPDNVLVTADGDIRVADFGLVGNIDGPAEHGGHAASSDLLLTQVGARMGTPRYMAPEQIEKPTSVDHRADIYSLGVVLYEMLTGELPIGRFQPPSQKVQLDVRIDHVVLRALEKEPDRRYQRASEVKLELASAGPPIWQAPAPAVKQSLHATTDREAIRARVQLPAIGLMITGFIGLLSIAGILLYALAEQSTPPSAGRATEEMTVVALFPALLLMIVAGISFVIAFGGWHLWRLRSYGLAATAAILAMLPCTPACFLGLPMGIWALVVLLDPKVRAAFGGQTIEPQSSPARGFSMPSPASSDAKATKMAFVVLAAVAFAVCAGIIPAVLLPAMQAVRQSASQAQSSNNLKQLGIALHNYHDVYGCFPPAVVRDADGNPLYSGRVLLLPFLAQEHIYRSFDLTEAWDSPRNEAISHMSVNVFMDPSSSARDQASRTDYFFVTGKGTMFEDGKNIQLTDILDGTSNTIAMVEARGKSKSWAEPGDIDLSFPQPLPEGNHSNGNLVLFADGSVRMLPKNLSPTEVRSMATIAGIEPPGSLNAPGGSTTPLPIRPAAPPPIVLPQTPAPPVPAAPPEAAPPPEAIAPPGAPPLPTAPATPGATAPTRAPAAPQPEEET